MSGKRTGVVTQIKAMNKKCLFTHCYGHALNLAVKDVCNHTKCLKDTFDTAREICKLVTKSPQRDTHLKEIRLESGNMDPGVHSFCPTRWTLHGQTLQSILDNHKELMELWDWSLSVLNDTEMKARIRGVQSYMKKFDFLFGCHLGKLLLSQTDNLSKTIQKPQTSAVEAQSLAKCVLSVLASDRSDERFQLFWDKVQLAKSDLDIDDAQIPRKRKISSKFETGERGTYFYDDKPENMYKRVYFEGFDSVIAFIKDRFEQEDYKIYAQMQGILLSAVHGQECPDNAVDAIETFYGEDFNKVQLKDQLRLLPTLAIHHGYEPGNMTIEDVIRFMQSLNMAQRHFVSEVNTITKLMLLAPATNAVSERSFSALKRLKTYMRSTMRDDRLFYLMILHIHKHLTDKLDLVEVANRFVGNNDSRKKLFGTFSQRDLTRKKAFASTSTQTVSQ